MKKLSAFWKTHRLGMFYGFLWFFVVMFVFFVFDGKARLTPSPTMVVTLASCLLTGIFMTALFRKWLKGIRFFLPLALLSQAMGAALFGKFMGLFETSFFLPMMGSGPTLLSYLPPKNSDDLLVIILGSEFGQMFFYAVFGCFSIILVPLFLPLAFLNTWHLWRLVNKPAVLPQAAI